INQHITRRYNFYSSSCSFALMPKNQKIKAYFYIFENYAKALSCGWQTATLGHPPHPTLQLLLVLLQI
ncbi:hypothetical protein, partial [Leeuwenhoekiella marinoflava]|uniref:hypothetical protein n=1 Tax=Leeuwenhoekiella marinoflava TaxID=988 RepID=UPI003002CD0A